MFPILLVGLVASCAAAPHFPPWERPHFYPPPPPHGGHFHHHHNDPFSNDMFDTSGFWAQMDKDMKQFETLMTQFYQKFPGVHATQGIEGNEYRVTIPLSGYSEREIVVKAREGLLMVQAVQHTEGGGQRSYLDLKTLPSYVNVTGSWNLQNGVLRIVFPLNTDTDTDFHVVEVTDTPATEHSREDMAPRQQPPVTDVNVDVGLQEEDEERELNTNEISRNPVEATTYAVDLKDEVEFVPVRY